MDSDDGLKHQHNEYYRTDLFRHAQKAEIQQHELGAGLS